MDLTVSQILQQGLAAHKAGNHQEAGRFYRAILQVQPKHANANHNLGLIAVSMNQSDVALPFFKIAIDVNPNIEQFWLSYIEALIAERQFENAKRAIKKGTKKGLARNKLHVLKQKLASFKARETLLRTPSQAELDSLLKHYQTGRPADAEKLAISMTQRFPEHQFGWKVLGALLEKTGRKSEALKANQRSVQLAREDPEAHNNLGIILQKIGRLNEAEASCRQAISLKPDYAEAHYNLGNALRGLGRLEETIGSHRQAIALKPGYAQAHYNLGNTLKELGRLEEAEASYRQVLAITPDFAHTHYNLGNVLKELGRLEEAEASYTQAISLKSDYAEAYNNLGITRQELGRLEETEASYRQAIVLKPDYAEAHDNLGAALYALDRLKEAEASFRQAIASQPNYAKAHNHLGIVLYISGDTNSGLESLEKAKDIDPDFDENKLALAILHGRKARAKTQVSADNLGNLGYSGDQFSHPLVLNRVVEAELITSLYKVKCIELDKFDNSRISDPRYGDGKCSRDFNLFKDDSPIIKSFAEDLIIIMRRVVKSNIYITDSFFNILGAGGGTTPHSHISKLDADEKLNIGKQKYSLVYYLSVGDQNCKEPGILKLYDPNEDILPCEGMIAIFPADRKHSAVYGGKEDRVMVGVNFYSL